MPDWKRWFTALQSMTVLSIVAALPAVAAPLPQGMEFVTSVEGISEYRLQNGLRVLLFPDPSKETATVNITYLVGSRHENYGETGMAHLLEHLVFKGTPRHPNIPKELSEHGARPNGTTWLDRTNYFETFSATDTNLEWALDLEADRMVNSFIAKKDLDSEMTVVRNEFESGENNPQSVMYKRITSVAYDWHNNGKSTIGNRSDIENVNIERLQAFYKKHYQPDNAVLVVAGKIDPDKTLALVSKYFAPIPRPTRKLDTLYTVEPVQDGERSFVIRRVGDVQLLSLAYHVPSAQHDDFAAIQMLNTILSDTPTGRLHKALVEKKLAASVGGFSGQFHDPGLSLFFATLSKADPMEPARDAMLKNIEALATEPITAEELERARSKYLKQFDLNLAATESAAIGLTSTIALGDWRLLFYDRDRVKKLTVADVQRIADKYFKPSNRTLGQFIPTDKPDRAEIPAVPNVAALLKDYKGGEAVAQGENFDPSPANIEARTKRIVLPGGLQLALLAKKTRGATVNANLQLRFGDEASLQGKGPAGSMTGSMLTRGGKRLTRQQLQDEFDKLKAQVNISGNAMSANASIQTTRENLPAVLKLVIEAMRDPIFPEGEFAQLKREMLTGLEAQKRDPQALGFNTFNRLLNAYQKSDPRYTGTFDETIADVNAVALEDVKAFHTAFYGASNAQLAVVGDFDEGAVTQIAAGGLEKWSSPKPFARLVSKLPSADARNQTLETPDKANAVFVAGIPFTLRDDDADYPAIVLGNYMMGGGFLNSRLATRIRQKEGLSYGVASFLQVSSHDKVATFGGNAIYAPQNVAKLETAFNEEIARALKDGFTADEIAAAKSGLLQSYKVNRAQDGTMAGTQANYLYLSRTFKWNEELEQKIAALTPEVITAAMRRHIDPAKFTVVKAGDFAGKVLVK
ncbi:MAG: pitrilysin family protein [Burkholderiales bacterium]